MIKIIFNLQFEIYYSKLGLIIPPFLYVDEKQGFTRPFKPVIPHVITVTMFFGILK
jgi:hypothetical protein